MGLMLPAATNWSPYEALLGAAFATLHPHVRRTHLAPLRAEGTIDVEHGPGWLTRPIVWLMKLPAAGPRQPVRLDVAADGSELVWTRRIGESVLRTRQYATGSRLPRMDAARAGGWRLRVRDSRPHRERKTGGGGVTDEFRHYRRWFYAAAIYNAVWGSAVVLFPGTLLRIAGMNVTGALPLVQVIGMMVGVYASGYYLLAREPRRYSGLISIGLAGKTFGPLGFVYSASTGALPWSFGWICVFNDIIWWPVFWRFALEHARGRGAPDNW